MFAGKTEELIRRIERARIAKQSLQVFRFGPKPDRSSSSLVESYDGRTVEAVSVTDPWELLDLVRDETQVVAIDDCQFLGEHLDVVCDTLAGRGIRVIAAGLDTDWRGEPFMTVARLLAKAEFVDKLSAICTVCGNVASRSQRLIDGKPAPRTAPEARLTDDYEARCRDHHELPD